jgi:hypothetical protein
MAALDDVRGFRLEEASINLWAFKGPTGSSDEAPRYSGYWVDTTDQVDAVLRQIVQGARQRINEVIDYDLLAQNNEGSALTIPTNETYADRLLERAAAETDGRRVVNLAQLRNSSFYDIKLVYEDTVIHAIRKTDRSWQGKRAIGLSTLLFQENVLALEDRPKFDIDAAVDFIIVGGEILILDKAHFESVLRYKATLIEDFTELQGEAEFTNVFVDIGPLVAFVGENKLHLRRLSAIRQKGHYKDAGFMQRLRELHEAYGLHLAFDGDGKVVVSPETCRDVITALLDHRLASAFSESIYDVPSTTPVRLG